MLTFRLKKKREVQFSIGHTLFCCFIQLTCHVTKTSSISGLHAQKIGKPQIEFLTSSLLDKSAKCISCFSKGPTIHSTKWLLPLNTKQIMHADDLYNVFWRNIVSRQIKFCLGSLILIAFLSSTDSSLSGVIMQYPVFNLNLNPLD